MAPIRAVVFDLFDTLVDLRYEDLPLQEHEGRRVSPTTRELHAALAQRAEADFDAFATALLAVDRELRDARYAEGRELPTEERFAALVARLGLDDDELPAILTAVHMGMLRSTVAVPEHHTDLLASLRRRVRLGLCSNFSHSETAFGILEEAGLHGYLDAVVVSDAVGFRKPRGEIFEAVLRELDVAPEEMLHVGDNLRDDVAGARALGIRTAWVTRRVEDPEQRLKDYEGPPPDVTIRDLAEIPALLSRGEIVA
jgi:putative hydrolase of the HAD superfamily